MGSWPRNMLRFTDTPQHFPEVKPPELRKKDFEEIYKQFNNAQAAEQ